MPPSPIPEVRKAFDEHIKNIPLRFIDLHATDLRLIDRKAIEKEHEAVIASITEADIEQHTSYANQRRKDVIQTMVKGVVKYAVLSHTWQQSSQFRYKQMISNTIRDGPGWSMLMKFVEFAKDKFRCRFGYADMVCIDLESESGDERQESVKSNFDWFRNAYICIVYLANTRFLEELKDDRWFKRVWPLTELLAPIRIKFYGAGWEPLNTKCPGAENDKADRNFLKALSETSGISTDDLRSFLPGSNRVREKLSWASEREARVPGDEAYSLVSIFASPMMIIHDKPEMAFLRLMLHTIPKSRECDAFAWAGKRANNHPAIASSPACYGIEYRDRELHPDPHHYFLCGDRSFSLGYDHLKIRVVLIKVAVTKAKAGYTIKSSSHNASINMVKLLLEPFQPAEAAIGVIDYDWTDEPGKGKLGDGARYFGFLLGRSSAEVKWEKADTDRVIFLESKETNDSFDLEVLHLLCSPAETGTGK